MNAGDDTEAGACDDVGDWAGEGAGCWFLRLRAMERMRKRGPGEKLES